MDVLTSAVVQTAQHEAVSDWDGLPRLYALVKRAALDPLSQDAPEQVRAASAEALIPIEQAPPEGELAEFLAGIHWPTEVAGCVLVTEVRVVPAAGEDKTPLSVPGTGQAGQPATRQARLTVGVVRENERAARHMCCLQFPGGEDLLMGPDLADDLVKALIGTL